MTIPQEKQQRKGEGFIEHQYTLHAQDVFRKCLRYAGGDTQWAEDVTHDVFLRLMEKQHELADRENLGGWLQTVAYRCCLDRLRRERSIWSRVRYSLGQAQRELQVETPENLAQAKEGMGEVLAILDQMPPKERLVCTMAWIDEMPQKDIAETLGLSKGYVSKLMQRATERVRQAGWEVPDA